MKAGYQRCAWLMLALGLVGCASTQMTSLANPEWSSTEIRRILVLMGTNDLQVRQSFETSFGERSALPAVEFVPSYTLFFPGQQLGAEDLARRLRDARIDAILWVSQGEQGVSTATLPSTATTGCSLWTSAQGCIQTRTTVSGGGTVEKPWASYSVLLVDPSTGTTIWLASARSGGNAFASWNDLRNSLTDKVVQQLVQDGILRR